MNVTPRRRNRDVAASSTKRSWVTDSVDPMQVSGRRRMSSSCVFFWCVCSIVFLPLFAAAAASLAGACVFAAAWLGWRFSASNTTSMLKSTSTAAMVAIVAMNWRSASLAVVVWERRFPRPAWWIDGGRVAIDAVEEHELPVDEVGVADAGVLGPAVVEEGVLLDAVEPALAVIDLALGEGHVDEALGWR